MDNQQQQTEQDDNSSISASDFNELKLKMAALEVFSDTIMNKLNV
jgi:hypothetical protein